MGTVLPTTAPFSPTGSRSPLNGLGFSVLADDRSVYFTSKECKTYRGPSGVTYLTGESLPEDLRDQFLLANYRGPSSNCYL